MLMRSLLLIAGAALFTACGSDSTQPGRHIEGTFNLTSINGELLPVTLAEDGPDNRFVVVSGAIVMTVDRTFTDVMTMLTVEDGQEETDTEELAGTYVISGNTISFTVFTSAGTGGYTGQFNEAAGTITQTLDFGGTPLTLVYTR